MTTPNPCTLEQARAAKLRVLAVFQQLAPVVGVGVTRTDGGYAVKVNLQAAPPEGIALPESVDGVPVRVEVVGTIRAL
ncbi:MAG TPA: hypothetical protein VKA46_24510 [Gemmataceae bacterium]|nr:hypothetical protein [Gemmataceae bacterium]